MARRSRREGRAGISTGGRRGGKNKENKRRRKSNAEDYQQQKKGGRRGEEGVGGRRLARESLGESLGAMTSSTKDDASGPDLPVARSLNFSQEDVRSLLVCPARETPNCRRR